MAETLATSAVFLLYGYVIAGILFALIFGWRGVDHLDHQAKGSGFAFRLLIFPGCVAFWPLLLRRWLKATGEPPEERNPHQ